MSEIQINKCFKEVMYNNDKKKGLSQVINSVFSLMHIPLKDMLRTDIQNVLFDVFELKTSQERMKIRDKVQFYGLTGCGL